jgi:cytidylate kinase
MKRIAIICILAVMFGAMPIYAADSSTAQQLQSDNPQLYQDLQDIKDQIMQNPDQITNLLQNKDVQNEISQWLQREDVQNQIYQLLQNPEVQKNLNILFQNQNIKNELNNILNG